MKWYILKCIILMWNTNNNNFELRKKPSSFTFLFFWFRVTTFFILVVFLFDAIFRTTSTRSPFKLHNWWFSLMAIIVTTFLTVIITWFFARWIIVWTYPSTPLKLFPIFFIFFFWTLPFFRFFCHRFIIALWSRYNKIVITLSSTSSWSKIIILLFQNKHYEYEWKKMKN